VYNEPREEYEHMNRRKHTSERIRLLLVMEDNISESELARRLDITPQNLHNKMKRDNFTEKELDKIANALDCDYDYSFTRRKTGEVI